MARLHIRLLGTLEVLRDGRALPLPQSKKTRALIGYLAVADRPQSRGHLCEMLWEGPDDPRAALRWSLTKIRPLLDDAGQRRLSTDREHVRFDAAAADVDALAIRRDVGSTPGDAPTATLQSAAERFRGDFLDGLDLPDCYRYHEWWTAERESLRALRVAILSALVDRLRGNPQLALPHARSRLLIDPFSESAHIGVIELLGAAGRPREALQQYEDCRRMLQGQLGARPSAALEHARSGLGPSAPSTGTQAGAVRPTPVPKVESSRPLVGRATERDRIRVAVDAAAGGRCREVLWITGEPGIGKTRLLEEIASQLRNLDGTVLAGRAYAAEMVRPYGAWIDALRSAALAVNEPTLRADLAPLLPELGVNAAGVDRNRLFDGVTRLLASWTDTGRPVGVVLDDVQWFDEASVALLHFAARALADSRVLIACAARSGELDDNPAIAGMVRALRREERLRHLPIDRLDGAAIRALVCDIASDADLERVVAESEGNALFALEIARALARGGSPLSDTLEGLIADRLAGLEPRALSLVSWAAALGRSFSPEILQTVSGSASGELIAAMEELERRGVICGSPSTAAAYDFTHDLIRQTAYRQLSAQRRRMVHLQIARALRAIPDDQAALAGDIAHHAGLGGDDRLAAEASVLAGERCLRVFAYAEASALAERAIERLRSLSGAERIRLHLAILKIAVHASVSVPQARDLDAEISRATVEAQQAGLSAEAATGFYLLSFRHHRAGDYTAARDDTLRAAEAGRTADPATAARALGTTGRCLALIERELPQAESMLIEAELRATQAGVDLVDIPWGLGLVRAFAGRYDEAIDLLERALALAEHQQDHWAECQCLQRLALIELERGLPGAARTRARAFAAVAAKMGEGSEAPFAATLVALAERALDLAGADDRVERAIEGLRDVDAKAHLSRALLFAAAADIERGDGDRAGARIDEAYRAAQVVGRRSEIVMALVLQARLALRRGDAASARRHAETAAADLGDPHAVAAHARQAAAAISAALR